MLRNQTRLAVVIVLLVAVVIAVVFSVRGLQQSQPTPTVDIARVQTEAVHIFALGLTSTAQALPTIAPTDTPVAPTATDTAEGTAGTPGTPEGSPTPSCYRLKFLQDVTIPDNTIMTPAQVFTKTWQVENTGLCAWRQGFKLVLVGGEAMGGSPYVLPAAVNPGGKVEVSVKMAAPTNKTGLIQGTWRMSDENGAFFGDALTVVIVIGRVDTTAPAAPTATP